ncbi:DUF4157 domain-containing protein [Plantactinospora sp. WMMB334]|uniref:eCIS core domain-containing protein n=1 Tax=Plantactinospora sp. WMMB334 TaxID=3404119 RepID=UPI003B927EBF
MAAVAGPAHDTARAGRTATPTDRGAVARPPGGIAALHRRFGNRGVRRLLQAKLEVGAVDDPLEREADRIAARVTGVSLRRSPAAGGGVPAAGGGVADAAVATAVRRSRGGGRPVPDGIRRRMEAASGADLSGVRIHVGAESDRLNGSLGARAFTVGSDVFVRRAEFAPGTAAGDALLAHELVHTVQQAATPVVRRAVNPVAGSVADAVAGTTAEALLQTTSPAQAAGRLLGSRDEWPYGRDAEADAHTEILASAKYLHRRRVEWRAELKNRLQEDGLDRQDDRPAWEKFQQATADGAAQEKPPWFLNPKAPGAPYSDLDDYQRINQDFMEQAKKSLTAPEHDPQRRLGATYDRDTNFPFSDAIVADEHQELISISALELAPGRILRLFTDSNVSTSTEYRFHVGRKRNQDGVTTLDAVVMPTTTGELAPAGTRVEISELPSSALKICQGNTVLAERFFPTMISATRGFFESVIAPADAQGPMGAGDDEARFRNRSPELPHDEAMLNIIRGRSDPTDLRSYHHTVGPWANRLNIKSLGWGVSVALYRRLGGDATFQEAQHDDRADFYTPLIMPPRLARPAARLGQSTSARKVDASDPEWYLKELEHQPGRFVGGRSNSTLNYMQSASLLWQRKKMTSQECIDLIAFVIADMVVSGNHSMEECMTTVVMAAPVSPPWNRILTLLISRPTPTLTLWLTLIDRHTIGSMRDETRETLEKQMGRLRKRSDQTLQRTDQTVTKDSLAASLQGNRSFEPALLRALVTLYDQLSKATPTQP